MPILEISEQNFQILAISLTSNNLIFHQPSKTYQHNSRQQHDEAITALRQDSERHAKELQAKYEKKMKVLREELELRRKTEIHEIEEVVWNFMFLRIGSLIPSIPRFKL